MAKFCTKCGKPLVDGKTCSCSIKEKEEEKEKKIEEKEEEVEVEEASSDELINSIVDIFKNIWKKPYKTMMQYKEKNVKFVGGIYDFKKLDSIRHFSLAYFHGHSVGGTNPSLLEAMAAGCFVFAHDNIFNRAVLKDNALYYPSAEKVTENLNSIDEIVKKNKATFTARNIEVIRNEYSWEHLVDEHEKYFKWLIEQK